MGGGDACVAHVLFPRPFALAVHCVPYLHLSGLVTSSASVAIIRPAIKGAAIIWVVWLHTIHDVALGNRRMAATAPASSAPRFTPSRSPRPGARLLPDGLLQSSATRRGVRQM